MYRRRMAYPRRASSRPRWSWEHTIANNASPSASANSIDLLALYRTHAGISINIPEFTIWRVHIRVSITITLAAAVAAADGVVCTCFVDSLNQTLDNPVSSPRDQHWMLYSTLYASEYALMNGDTGAGTKYLTRDFDIKVHRKLASLDDTLWFQIYQANAASVITGYSYNQGVLMRVGRK